MTLAFIFSSVGAGEWLILLAVVLVVIGPKNLPSAARKFGQYYSKFRRAAENFKRQLLDMDTDVGKAVREVNDAANDMYKTAEEMAQMDDSASASGSDSKVI